MGEQQTAVAMFMLGGRCNSVLFFKSQEVVNIPLCVECFMFRNAILCRSAKSCHWPGITGVDTGLVLFT